MLLSADPSVKALRPKQAAFCIFCILSLVRAGWTFNYCTGSSCTHSVQLNRLQQLDEGAVEEGRVSDSRSQTHAETACRSFN
jgi:hypothetical protein